MCRESDFKRIVSDNEQAAAQALARGDFVQTYLLVHTLIESFLMVFFRVPDEKDLTFSDLIDKYKSYLQSVDYPYQEFVDELTQFNRRRNRIVHQLWRKEFSFTNQKTRASAAVMIHGLLIEWLETLDDAIMQYGFRYHNSTPEVNDDK